MTSIVTARSAAASVIERSVDLFGSAGEIGKMKWGGEKIADIASRITVWDVVGNTTVAATDAARAVDAQNPHLHTFFDGTLAYHGARDGARMPSRIALAQDTKTDALARLMSIHDDGSDLQAFLKTVPKELRGKYITNTLDLVENSEVQAQAKSWIVVNPQLFDGVVNAADPAKHFNSEARQAGIMLMHELEHLVTPPAPSEFIDDAQKVLPISSLEEGIAHLFARSEHAQKAFKAATGVDTHTDQIFPVYILEKNAVGRYLHMSGTGLGTDAGYAESYKLLQGGTLTEAPQRIARAISARHSLSPKVSTEIENAIRTNPTDWEAVEAIVKQHSDYKW